MSTIHSFWREQRAKAERNQGPSAYQPNGLPPGQTGSRHAHTRCHRNLWQLARIYTLRLQVWQRHKRINNMWQWKCSWIVPCYGNSIWQLTCAHSLPSKFMPSGTHTYLMFICTASIHTYHATEMYNCQAHNATLHGSKLARISTLPKTLSKTRGRCHVIVATLYVDTVTQVLPLSVRTMSSLHAANLLPLLEKNRYKTIGLSVDVPVCPALLASNQQAWPSSCSVRPSYWGGNSQTPVPLSEAAGCCRCSATNWTVAAAVSVI